MVCPNLLPPCTLLELLVVVNCPPKEKAPCHFQLALGVEFLKSSQYPSSQTQSLGIHMCWTEEFLVEALEPDEIFPEDPSITEKEMKFISL